MVGVFLQGSNVLALFLMGHMGQFQDKLLETEYLFSLLKTCGIA